MSNAMSLKAKIRNISKQKNIPAQVILQNYMFERLLVRLSHYGKKAYFWSLSALLWAVWPTPVSPPRTLPLSVPITVPAIIPSTCR